jgi:DNA-binding NarL/FixJ family response regulator
MLKRRVMLVEDHPIFRRGLRRLLEETGRYQVVCEASSGHEAIHLADVNNPELVIMDVQLPGVTGLKIARALRKLKPAVRIVFLSMHVDNDRLFDSIRAGASAFLTKDVDGETLLETLHRVLAGENILNNLVLTRPALAQRVLSEFRAISANSDGECGMDRSAIPLSNREIEVLDCVAQGLTNREISEALFVTEQTVKNHMTAVLRKLDVNDRVQAVLFGIKKGWIEIGPQPYTTVHYPQSA